MTRAALLLRPEPGNAHTAERLCRAGFQVHRLPLFAVGPLVWAPPDPAGYDALLLTSANAARHAGNGLDPLRHLPVVAVGAATAAAARAAGLNVALVGDSDAAGAAGRAHRAGLGRLLHLAGRDRVALAGVDAVSVYASNPLPVEAGMLAALDRPVALLHSPRAAARLDVLAARDVVARGGWTLAALSPAAAAAAGGGWRQVVVAPAPTDAALLAVLGRAD